MTRSRTLEIERYYNPWLPGGFGWMAHDDNGNYGFGRTQMDAVADFFKQAGEG